MKRHPLVVAALTLVISAACPPAGRPAFAAPPATQPAPRPVPDVQRVLIISVDGLRPDVLLRADAPHLRSLMDNGAFTMWARTTAVALTLPSHVSMLTGVPPVRHGIHWNEDLAMVKPYYPKVPTIFELAHNVGYHTAMISGKVKFDQIPRPGAVDWAFVPTADALAKAKEAGLQMEDQYASKKNVATDDVVTSESVRILTEHRPEVMFVHFASGDVAGHGKGWGTPEHLAAVANIDRGIGQILAASEKLGLLKNTAVIVSADHGGAGRTHGADDERSRRIPWILSAPGVRKNYDLTRNPELEVNTYDTFATACYLMGIPVPNKIDGKPIVEAFENRELLK
jgi:arylsulfatase A-like enzyme